MDDNNFQIDPELGPLVEKMVASYDAHPMIRHIDQAYLPSRTEIVRLVGLLLELIYPGFVGRQHLTKHNVGFHVGDLLPRISELAYGQILKCLCYLHETEHPGEHDGHSCTEEAKHVTTEFIEQIPEIRELLATDVKASYDGDPAALNSDEVVLAYPGLIAISVHRLAHALYQLKVPLMPRVMNEWAHAKTGIDIHPGAEIGRHFFIDHGTGVVIGETTEIGENVKVYQGVTLGAISFPRDEQGRLIREAKRHPTVKDNVTIYANAIVLGGETVIGENAVIGGSVFVTSSVPANSVVTFQPPELRVKQQKGAPAPPPTEPPGHMPDYVI